MTDKAELPTDDDTGERFTEEALAERADAVPSPVTETTWDANAGRIRDEDADLYFGNGNDVELFAASNRHEVGLWSDMLPAKRVLQRAGFGCWFVDKRGVYTGKRGPWIAVGKAVVSHAEFKAWAERTRRTARQQRDDA